MPKRFTESDKWRDAWFARLSNGDKLAWLYICDACDGAGVFDIVAQNDTAALGERIDWDAFILQSEGRVVRLSADKLWLVRFIDFQYPRGLKSSCKAHGPVIRSIAKHDLPVDYGGSVKNRDFSQRVQEREKETDKDTDTEPEKERPDVPESLRGVLSEWLAYKDERNESPAPTAVKQLAGRMRNLAGEFGPSTVEQAMRRAMANGWKGWDHDVGKGQKARPSQSQEATERFLARHGNGDTGEGSVGGQPRLRHQELGG